MKFALSLILLCLLSGWNSARAGTCTTITPQISTICLWARLTCSVMPRVGTIIFSRAASSTGTYLTGC